MDVIHDNAELMDAIESQVQLPLEALPLEEYARAYKYASATRVAAYYFRPNDGEDPGFCESTKAYGPNNGQILLACPPPDGMKRNERRWLGSEPMLPAVSDGGCAYVEVEYNMMSKLVITATCNG